jgi:tRNA dimethylallyltransferase
MVPAQGVSAIGPKVVVLAGPTASGKTALALEMARLARGGSGSVRYSSGGRDDAGEDGIATGIEIGIEIINADSMQVYRGMDIGTAKPTREELAEVPHHLIDIRDPSQPFTAGEFVREARAAIDDIHRRGKRALVVGGTGFYLRALFWGIWEGPAADLDLRARLDELPLSELHARLSARDPSSASRIGAADRYRLTRALELIELRGKTPSELEAEMSGAPDPGLELWVVDREPAELEARMRLRARQMLEQGLIDETRRVREAFPSARALGAVGYKEVCEYLDGIAPSGRKIAPGIAGLESEIELATRQLIKKQRTWFKNLCARLGPEASRRIVLPGAESEWREGLKRVYGSM